MNALGRPDLYIGGQKMQAGKSDPRPALAGLTLDWGNESRFDFDPPATLAGQLLIRGRMPDYLDVGAPVGLVDPVSARCLFAGSLEPLTAVNENGLAGARRVTFRAASPLAELQKHNVIDFDWPHEESAPSRRNRLASALPDDWTLGGVHGVDWINQGRQLGQSVQWITLAERYARGYVQRFHDTSTYTPGAGLTKRITIAAERPRSYNGVTLTSLDRSAVSLPITWSKTPGDVITDVQLVGYGGAFPQGDESEPFEYLMSYHLGDQFPAIRALQRRYGVRQRRVEVSLSSFNTAALSAMARGITSHWIDTQTHWRPTSLELPDSRIVPAADLLRLLAVDTRHAAAVTVPDAGADLPGIIRAHVMTGSATWTGKKWETTLTLGRTL